MVLLMGIVVALVITLTALVYKDQMKAARNNVLPPKKRTSWNVTLHELIKSLGTHNSSIHFRWPS
jgi:hypothetical protein